MNENSIQPVPYYSILIRWEFIIFVSSQITRENGQFVFVEFRVRRVQFDFELGNSGE